VQSSVISEILAAGREMLAHPVDLLPHARETIAALAPDFRILIITKGDLLDQERKVAQSGLGDLVHAVEIVSDKTAATYRTLFARHGTGPERAMMVGNSLKSDVLPALEAGAWGIYVPHGLTWALERADVPQGAARFRSIPDLAPLPALVRGL
jgi:putative hydrolase of the HAD superfamily